VQTKQGKVSCYLL